MIPLRLSSVQRPRPSINPSSPPRASANAAPPPPNQLSYYPPSAASSPLPSAFVSKTHLTVRSYCTSLITWTSRGECLPSQACAFRCAYAAFRCSYTCSIQRRMRTGAGLDWMGCCCCVCCCLFAFEAETWNAWVRRVRLCFAADSPKAISASAGLWIGVVVDVWIWLGGVSGLSVSRDWEWDSTSLLASAGFFSGLVRLIWRALLTTSTPSSPFSTAGGNSSLSRK